MMLGGVSVMKVLAYNLLYSVLIPRESVTLIYRPFRGTGSLPSPSATGRIPSGK